MKSFSKMTAASAAALSTLAFIAMATPAAQAGEFCNTNNSGMRGCGFSTLEQCQATISGTGGSCARDPFYNNPNSAMAYQPKRTRSRSAIRLVRQTVEH
jgi:uncharacterized protein DUF3551